VLGSVYDSITICARLRFARKRKNESGLQRGAQPKISMGESNNRVSTRGDSWSNASLWFITRFIPRPLTECKSNRSMLASLKLPFLLILVGTTVALWRYLRNNELEVLMRTRRLLRKVRHSAMITPVSSLHTGVIHISPSYWTIIARLKFFSNGNCPLHWNSYPMLYANPLLQNSFNLLWHRLLKLFLDVKMTS